ncbi:hypothetical protein M409DRAFT_67036 [Zasmidium cellare ATCC 36951]|uniref:Zn(2)-C6 fungal-type domain-containing protein n=1 Tax=Zasmidium cellare ATCC 36951 TaxID=1080233 RepID=A0A6A6CG68_ZASCE|nr:uncharacterized protein M409DRAFT_67036 [Zasmidium cellare ATCC 36951]KAF2165643.1 hypothetical protein M409DRAFT_67036 [Zasmidium cellare ATCC 36951]
MPSTAPSKHARKLRRNPRACDACSRRSVRCQPAQDDTSSCQNCVDYDEPCTFDRPGRQPRKRHAISASASSTVLALTPQLAEKSASHWTPQLAINQALVMDLTEIFFEVVYPVFPLFHRPSLVHRVSRGEHLQNRPLYGSVAAMCALSAARARDGALLRSSWDISKLQDPTSEQLFEAAVDATPKDVLGDQSLDYMRASLLLAITAIQYGSPKLMKFHLSRYQTYVAVGSLHDETHWPAGISVIEAEERRRVFWSAYTLDVFTSIVWGGIISSREASSNVSYPAENDDETLASTSVQDEPLSVSWLRGWNYVTDMYRILEYAASDLQRSRAAVMRTPRIQALQSYHTPSQATVLDRITSMYGDLPDIFKVAAQPTHDPRRDLFSFQAANIAATVQLVRMVYFSSDDSTLQQKCQVASEVLTGFAGMPTAYLRAISSPLFHHLAEIGRIFGAAFGSRMSAALYHSVRSVLLDLAAFLADLEKRLCCATDASKKVESQVVRIDRFIHEQHQLLSEPLTQFVGDGNSESTDVVPVALTGPDVDQQSLDISFPPELFEDWNWAFTFT